MGIAQNYIVQRGDTLSLIARRMSANGCPVTWQQIATQNRLPNPNQLNVGQYLFIPCSNQQAGGQIGGQGGQTQAGYRNFWVTFNTGGWSTLWHESDDTALAARLRNHFNNVQVTSDRGYTWASVSVVVTSNNSAMTAQEAGRLVNLYASELASVDQSSIRYGESVAQLPPGTTPGTTPGTIPGTIPGTPPPPDGCKNLSGTDWLACQLGVTRTTAGVVGFGIGAIFLLLLLSRR